MPIIYFIVIFTLIYCFLVYKTYKASSINSKLIKIIHSLSAVLVFLFLGLFTIYLFLSYAPGLRDWMSEVMYIRSTKVQTLLIMLIIFPIPLLGYCGYKFSIAFLDKK